MSASTSTKRQRSSHGSTTELFKYESGVIILMDYNEERTARFVRLGEFVINLIMQAINPILVTCVCMVNELQWPITKDSPIIRVGERSFVFGLPGTLYGLQFPPRCEPHVIDSLERVFIKFGHYKDLNHKGIGYPVPDNDQEIWNKLRSLIIPMLHETLSQFGHIAGKSPFCVGNNDSSSALLRMIRISATVKMISRSILSGSLKPVHIGIQDATRPAREATPYRKIIINLEDDESAYALMSVFTNVVDAIEISWAIASGEGDLVPENSAVSGRSSGLIVWRLSRKGIVFFMEELALATALEKMMQNK